MSSLIVGRDGRDASLGSLGKTGQSLSMCAPLLAWALGIITTIAAEMLPAKLAISVMLAGLTLAFTSSPSGAGTRLGLATQLIVFILATAFVDSDGLSGRHLAKESSATSADDSQVAQFARAVTLGDRGGLSSQIESSFLVLGVVHLLVVSGLHLSLYARLIFFVLSVPLRGLYASRCVDARRQFEWFCLFRLVFCFLAFAAAFALGLPVSAKRAMLFVVAHELFAVSGGMSSANTVLIVFFLQSILLPDGFATIGNLLSWLAYLLVYDYAVHGQKTLVGIVEMQLALCALTLAVCGTLSFAAPLANLVVVPAFPIVFTLCLVRTGLGASGGAIVSNLDPLIELFLVACVKSAEAVMNAGLFLERPHFVVWLVGTSYLCLRLFRVLQNMTIACQDLSTSR